MIKYVIPALFLFGVVVGGFVFSIYKLYLSYSINLNHSILETQKNIEKLRYFERLDRNLLYVLIPLFSIAFLIVMAKAILNFDLYVFGIWMIIFTGQSFIVALIIVFFLKKFPDKNLQKALKFLREIKDLESH